MDAFLTTPHVAALAARQHGVVSTAQLLAAGLGRGATANLVQRGWLHRVHRGVYAVGHQRLTLHGRWWAAVLATGGVLSHRSAAAAWDLIATPSGPIDVTTRRQARSTRAIRVHRSKTLDPLNDVVHDEDDLPRTSVARTLVDLADITPPPRLKRVLERAERLRILDVVDLPGRRRLPRIADDPPLTKNELEQRFLETIERHHLPTPQVNTLVAGKEVDFHWPHRRLIVETDGAATHLTSTAFEDDRRRDAELLVNGYRVVRFTWRQVTDESQHVAETLRRLL
jgi:very-short-patch-repair endonuclease